MGLSVAFADGVSAFVPWERVREVDKATVARLETAAQSPRLDTIRRLAAALGCPVHALLMDEYDDEDCDAP